MAAPLAPKQQGSQRQEQYLMIMVPILMLAAFFVTDCYTVAI